MNRERYLNTGSKKPWFNLRVDVASILADIMAIRLRQALRRIKIEKMRKEFVSVKPRKRICISNEESGLPLKKKRSK